MGSRNDVEAERLKAETEAKLLLGISTHSAGSSAYGQEIPWSDFREEYTIRHLATLRDSSADDAENRLDIAERILSPRTLGEFASGLPIFGLGY